VEFDELYPAHSDLTVVNGMSQSARARWAQRSIPIRTRRRRA